MKGNKPNLDLVNMNAYIKFGVICQCVLKIMSGHLLGLDARKPGAQWLSGRVLDSRPKGRGFEPHRRHCVVVLEQDTFILA